MALLRTAFFPPKAFFKTPSNPIKNNISNEAYDMSHGRPSHELTRSCSSWVELQCNFIALPILTESRKKRPQGRQHFKKKKFAKLHWQVYKSNSALKDVDERGTIKVRANLSYRRNFPALSSPSAWGSHRWMWMARNKKFSMKKKLGLSFYKYTFGNNFLRTVNFLLPRVGTKMF